MKFNCHLIIHRLSAILLATTIFANLSITSALATTSKNPFQDVSENAPMLRPSSMSMTEVFPTVPVQLLFHPTTILLMVSLH